jgi:hypothetical protein
MPQVGLIALDLRGGLLEAVKQDSMDLYGGGVVQTAMEELRLGRLAQGNTVSFLTAPRGLLNETPGLYSPSEIERWRAELPAMRIREVSDVNHYSIVMGAAGASAVARELRRSLGPQPASVGGRH